MKNNVTTLCVFSDCKHDLKIAVYSDNKTYTIYKYPEYYNRFPVYAGQKIELLYEEGRYWSYDDDKYKTHCFGYSKSISFIVPLSASAQGEGTLFIGDKYMTIQMDLHGALGWVKYAIEKANCNV